MSGLLDIENERMKRVTSSKPTPDGAGGKVGEPGGGRVSVLPATLRSVFELDGELSLPILSLPKMAIRPKRPQSFVASPSSTIFRQLGRRKAKK